MVDSPTGKRSASEGTLHVVATPIGNLEDVTLRALRVLGDVDVVLAEDTRRTRTLLSHHGLNTRCLSLNAQNEQSRIRSTLADLGAGRQVALVSDAGTPLISDPGSRLVAAARDAGGCVVPIPGPSALLAAIAGCGLRVQPFTFLGFLPRTPGARRKLLAGYRGRVEALIVFESPRRVAATLDALAEVLGEGRRACVARELTKLHEEFRRGTLGELAQAFSGEVRGEITLVIEGADETEVSAQAEMQKSATEEDLMADIARRVQAGERPRTIASELARGTNWPRRELYARAVEAQRTATDSDSDDDEGAGS